MKKLKVLILLVAVISLCSCKKTDSSGDSIIDYTATSDGIATSDGVVDEYSDGTYCADIDYYNPETGTRSTYTLNVEVESHEVTVIQWSNGGWLDSSHFNPEALDSSGFCSFTAFDGNQYDVQITGSECSSTDEKRVSNNEYYEKQQITCPECGFSKYSSEDICSGCKRTKREQEDIAEHTCQSCGQHDSFMWKGDALCSDCKRAAEE